MEEYIRRHGAGIKAKQAKGRERQLKKITAVTGPKISKSINLNFGEVNRAGDLVLDVNDLSVAFGENIIF